MQIKFIDKVSNLIMLNLLYVASVVTVIAIGSGESAPNSNSNKNCTTRGILSL